MESFVTSPVDIIIGSTSFQWNVYVAPIDDDMLLGLDFLKYHNVIVDLVKDELVIKDSVIPLTYGTASNVSKVANITVCKTTTVPPNTAVLLECDVNSV